MFGRRRVESEAPEEPVEEPRPRLYDEHPLWSVPGPREESEVDTSSDYIDLGALRIPAVRGMQMQAQMAQDGHSVVRLMLVLGTSGLQLSVAAAPRSGGVWDELREQIAEAYRADGAQVSERETRYGTELLVDAPAELPDGSTGTARSRVIGREGDRWFVRIDILGEAALGGEPGSDFEELIDRIVVVRGDVPMARLDLLPLHMPGQERVEVPRV